MAQQVTEKLIKKGEAALRLDSSKRRVQGPAAAQGEKAPRTKTAERNRDSANAKKTLSDARKEGSVEKKKGAVKKAWVKAKRQEQGRHGRKKTP